MLVDIEEGLSRLLKTEINIKVDDFDEQVINFYYPKIYQPNSILTMIRLEIGPLAALSPREIATISPYIGEFPFNGLEISSTKVLTVSPIRTFYEKAIILHREANRPKVKSIPSRYSRYYYNLYMIGNSDYKKEILKNYKLLNKVVKFKNKFYRDNFAHYDDVLNQNLRLVPDNYRIKELEIDYKNMQEMIFGKVPSFKKILLYLKNLENEINHNCWANNFKT